MTSVADFPLQHGAFGDIAPSLVKPEPILGNLGPGSVGVAPSLPTPAHRFRTSCARIAQNRIAFDLTLAELGLRWPDVDRCGATSAQWRPKSARTWPSLAPRGVSAGSFTTSGGSGGSLARSATRPTNAGRWPTLELLRQCSPGADPRVGGDFYRVARSMGLPARGRQVRRRLIVGSVHGQGNGGSAEVP